MGDLAALIGALAVLVTAVTGLVVGIRNSRRLATVHTLVEQVDAAVNGKKPGVPTISEQVTNQEAVLPLLKKVSDQVTAIHREIGSSE